MIIKKIISPTSKISKYILFLFFSLLYFSNHSYASFELKGYGARARGMGQAYAGLANTPDAIFLNCSGTHQINSLCFSFNYTKPFGIKELSYYSFAGVVPFSFGNLAAGISSFGNEIYRENSILINFSRSLTDNISYGVNAHYMKLQISGYGSDFSFGIDLGFMVQINSKLNWGFFTTNINRANISESKEHLPQTFVSGICFKPLNNLIINLDLYKDLPFPLEIRGGFEYLLFNKIALRSGFISETSEFCFGLGFNFKKFCVDYAVITHPYLGLTHQFSFQIRSIKL